MSEEIASLHIKVSKLKTLREALCFVQSRLDQHVSYDNVDSITILIDEIDRHRPLGSDGKHGNLHTPTCGCEDI